MVYGMVYSVGFMVYDSRPPFTINHIPFTLLYFIRIRYMLFMAVHLMFYRLMLHKLVEQCLHNPVV